MLIHIKNKDIKFKKPQNRHNEMFFSFPAKNETITK